MTWEVLQIIALLCQFQAATIRPERIYAIQAQCQVWYIDCLYDSLDAKTLGIQPKHMRQCIQKRSKELK